MDKNSDVFKKVTTACKKALTALKKRNALFSEYEAEGDTKSLGACFTKEGAAISSCIGHLSHIPPPAGFREKSVFLKDLHEWLDKVEKL
ncbi:MAG: hypothetical protein Q7R65_00540 [bacterium]|nr:hypothetical protein [bacterium]